MTTATDDRARPRVLVVDDDLSIRLLLREVLEDDCDVEDAGSGSEALEAYRRVRPDIVLLDVLMPGMTGFETCASLRELPGGEHTPVLMMTGLDDIASIQEAYRVGATDFVTKPMSYLVVAQRVRYMLRATRAAAELRASEREIARIAYTDLPTRLPNRAFAIRHLTSILDQRKPSDKHRALLSIGVEGLGRVNDTLGHEAGDRVLSDIGARIVACVRGSGLVAPVDGIDVAVERRRETDTVARVGGDEFAVLLGDLARPEDAAVVARRLLDALADPFAVGDSELTIRPSIGIVHFPPSGGDAASLLKNAGSALNHAKELGGSRLELYADSLRDNARRRLALERDLRHALARDQIEVHYQPQVSSSTQRVIAVEALARWRHPERGLVSPVEFIPVAEASGLIVRLGERVLEIACAQLKAWQGAGLEGLRVAVNVSAMQFRAPRLASAIHRIVCEAGLSPEQVELEITESALMDDTQSSDAVLAELSSMGFRIALDDFGTGYSSLSYLKRFPIDSLKVDRSFVRDVGSDPAGARLAAAIMAMARALELEIVVEGVETEEQLRFARQHGCTDVQGFFFSPPLPAAELSEWARAWRSRASERAPGSGGRHLRTGQPLVEAPQVG